MAWKVILRKSVFSSGSTDSGNIHLHMMQLMVYLLLEAKSVKVKNLIPFVFAGTVERGMRELRKLGIEQQLWETSRKELIDSSFLPSYSVSDYNDE